MTLSGDKGLLGTGGTRATGRALTEDALRGSARRAATPPPMQTGMNASPGDRARRDETRREMESILKGEEGGLR